MNYSLTRRWTALIILKNIVGLAEFYDPLTLTLTSDVAAELAYIIREHKA